MLSREHIRRFKAEHDAFTQRIEGITDMGMARRYGLALLNRLMFFCFVPGLSGSDRLDALAQTSDDFYHEIFLPLCFRQGRLFVPHPAEVQYGARIQIAGDAFARLFAFFDPYRWRLDERQELAEGDMVPGVLGTVFEQSIEQKRMGAYYTQEDITMYIATNTIIPLLLERARADEARRWLRRAPDRYIYPAVRHGVDVPLPARVAAGLDAVARRTGWNAPAPPRYGLPAEIWRETVARRAYYARLRARLEAGAVTMADDLVTGNLNLRQLALDTIGRCTAPDRLRAFWDALTGMAVLDPTCGAGAFLFAALDILAPLYAACLARMEAFAENIGCREVLARAAQHPNRRGFVLRSVIAHNLYGMDIMEEAVEIVNMRLFLKLAAHDASEMLPPFHIRVGDAVSPEAFGDVTAFDAILGNPPYVERPQVVQRGYRTEACGNLYALVVERALEMLHRAGRLGVIVPLSLAATERMRPLRQVLADEQRTLWLSHFDVYPAKLFEDAKQRVTIVLASGRRARPALFTTVYNRWRPAERAHLFSNLRYAPAASFPELAVIPKTGRAVYTSIFAKLRCKSPVDYVRSGEAPSFYVHRIPYNYIKAVNFVPYFWNEAGGRKKSEDYKPYYLQAPPDIGPVLAALNSTLFFWWWYLLFEGYHCGRREVHTFPVGLDEMAPRTRAELARLAAALMADYKAHSRRREAVYKTTGRVVYDAFYPQKSKPLIDAIDRVLAPHYDLSPEELDCILNYDIKYRVRGL